ncbi:rRNA maturation RNase YbeY [Roseicella aerolata]|uniref:Endoribonuclease YbeY n=1 Tax=Roseicella aerolata TaxID=2883479 RepID=A0A9X1L8D2_9PROT|nr:rRNA maturation RNase YbeY [Roseicella aerolata]MCB4822429.1 rRNA maturation RNase YbeY [Roseicella aerolata]
MEEDDVPDPGVSVEVVLADPAWRRLVPRVEALARRAVEAALRDSGEAGSVSVLLADDRELKRLNGEHRGKEKPTNVLSFPGMGDHLGDIALALGVVRREAKAAGKRPAAHFAHLVAHGALHLVGHDHLSAGEARRMERAEARAMHRMRLPNPWKPEMGRGVPA